MAPLADSRARLGALAVLTAAVLWGTSGVVFQWLGQGGGGSALSLGFWRAALAAAAMLAWLGLRDREALRVAPRDLGFFAGFGLVSVAIFFVLYPLAIRLTSVAVAVVLLYTAPAWVTLVGVLFLREPCSAPRLAALALAFAGTTLVAQVGEFRESLPGLAAGLGSGLTYASLTLLGRVAPPRYAPPTITLYTLGAGALFLALPAAWDPADLWAPWRTPFLASLTLYASLVTTAGCFLLFTTGVRLLEDAGKASLLATLEPPVAALLGFLVLGETLSGSQLVGGALILGAVLLLQAADPGGRPPNDQKS